MRTKASELCMTCRKIPWGNGRSMEQMLNLMESDPRYAFNTDDDINLMIFSTLNQYSNIWHCTDCWQLVMDRIAHLRPY
jgi:hypothetical protein